MLSGSSAQYMLCRNKTIRFHSQCPIPITLSNLGTLFPKEPSRSFLAMAID